MKLKIFPVTLKKANSFVAELHRHNKPVAGHKFSIGIKDENNVLCGIVIVGRPVSRKLDDGVTAEITRLCTNGTFNACSMLYAAARKAAKAMGYERIYTYTLPEEGGASLRAAGFVLDKKSAGGSHINWHNRGNRQVTAVGDDTNGGKWRWAA